MKQNLINAAALAAFVAAGCWAGALTLQIGNPEANAEAKGLQAALVAEVTACHEPAKSVVRASVVQMSNGVMRRTDLQVVPLKTAGMFAVIGKVPSNSVVDLVVTNPEYKNYEPRVLLRGGQHGIEWASVRRFYSAPPADSDWKALLGVAVD